ncbi:MAG TPA: ferritin-like domain-containing protein [Segetibacter sp.]|jgi:hypothetical protein
MTKNTVSENEMLVDNDTGIKQVSRRKFLGYAGATSGLVVLATACSKDEPLNEGIDLGSGDVGILNYAYALEQLEAAFYTQVMATPPPFSNVLEGQLMNDIKLHEIAHREFFKTALGSNAIPALDVDFSSITFTNRDSVLATAKAFEDLGVSAYNGAGRLLTSSANLVLAGKIASVEARHAAWIRDIISNGTFSSDVDANGLDISRTPMQVLGIAGKYIKTKINASNLPTS